MNDVKKIEHLSDGQQEDPKKIPSLSVGKYHV